MRRSIFRSSRKENCEKEIERSLDDEDLKYLEDIEWFCRRLLASLKIPPKFLDPNTSINYPHE